jgi:hypothetical protein
MMARWLIEQNEQHPFFDGDKIGVYQVYHHGCFKASTPKKAFVFTWDETP